MVAHESVLFFCPLLASDAFLIHALSRDVAFLHLFLSTFFLMEHLCHNDDVCKGLWSLYEFATASGALSGGAGSVIDTWVEPFCPYLPPKSYTGTFSFAVGKLLTWSVSFSFPCVALWFLPSDHELHLRESVYDRKSIHQPINGQTSYPSFPKTCNPERICFVLLDLLPAFENTKV